MSECEVLKIVDVEEVRKKNEQKAMLILNNMQYFVDVKFPQGIRNELTVNEIVILSGLARRSEFDAIAAIRLAYAYGMAKATKGPRKEDKL